MDGLVKLLITTTVIGVITMILGLIVVFLGFMGVPIDQGSLIASAAMFIGGSILTAGGVIAFPLFMIADSD